MIYITSSFGLCMTTTQASANYALGLDRILVWNFLLPDFVLDGVIRIGRTLDYRCLCQKK